jgi:hypothetical protein
MNPGNQNFGSVALATQGPRMIRRDHVSEKDNLSYP